MPQMAPIWWTMLFMTFIMAYMLYMIIMYFFITYKIEVNKNTVKKMKNMNWTW
uniref:ATP synthase F0 subunit 8 n=1 Tax=Apolygus lucorum TaxID=248454 RepID=V5IVA6_APOLU|nr:ATP synthase F0 subunit 8 [Apolygus lucorum]ADZ52278.1 ATP synthase F0 subunit 8 [Apolygus lucorum]ANT45815.1 ATP synthase F0 subunit 8 [Apolygus lucorum]